MAQTKKQSLIEAGTHTAVSAGVNLGASIEIYPLFGANFTAAQNVGLVAVFTVISVIRGYIVRRWFNRKHA